MTFLRAICMAGIFAVWLAGCGGQKTAETQPKTSDPATNGTKTTKDTKAVSPIDASNPAPGKSAPPPVTKGPKYVLRYNYAGLKPMTYNVTADAYESQGSPGVAESNRADKKLAGVASLVPEKTEPGFLKVTEKFKSIKAAVKLNGKLDAIASKQEEDNAKSQGETRLYNDRGETQLVRGTQQGIDVGFWGIVFPKQGVGVGATWEGEASIDTGSMVGATANPRTVPMTMTLKAVKTIGGKQIAFVTMRMKADVAEQMASGNRKATYSGTFTLEVDASFDIKTGVFQKSESRLDSNITGMEGTNTITIRTIRREVKTLKS